MTDGLCGAAWGGREAVRAEDVGWLGCGCKALAQDREPDTWGRLEGLP